jgi:Tol biopolymer transport system component
VAAWSNQQSRGTWMPPILLLWAALLFVGPAWGASAKTTRVTVNSNERQGNDNSFGPAAISSNGRYIAFESFASNLVRHDTNGTGDIFVRDRVSGKTTRVSISSAERQGKAGSFDPAISEDGRFVAFASDANNLVPGDTKDQTDVFVRDRKKGKTVRVSVATDGTEADAQSYAPAMSADGRYIVFYSEATNLVPNDSNGSGDVFLRDRVAHTTTIMSVDSSGNYGDSGGSEPDISADGRIIAFTSQSVNLVGGDGNSTADIFVHNRVSGKTSRASVDSDENEAHGQCDRPALSADGRFVAFESFANDLDPSDANPVDDVFVRDRQKGTTRIASVSSSEAAGNGLNRAADISATGRFVVFMSDSTTFVGADTKPGRDIYMRDRELGKTRLLSVKTNGTKGNGASIFPVISADGRWVAFASLATNLVKPDRNGDDSDIFLRGPLH